MPTLEEMSEPFKLYEEDGVLKVKDTGVVTELTINTVLRVLVNCHALASRRVKTKPGHLTKLAALIEKRKEIDRKQ